jgi:LEA14-like dessication related protein
MAIAAKRGVVILVFSLLFLLLAGGAAVYIFLRKFKKPEVVGASHVLSLGDDGILSGNTTLVLKNPNAYTLRVDSLSYAMKIKGQTYLKGHKEKPIVLRANSLDTFVLPFRAASKEMSEDFPTQTRAESRIVVDGYFSAGKIKKVHLRLPFTPKITFLRPPALVGQPA